MSTTCCNGHPSSVFQDSTSLLINPSSPDPRQQPYDLRNKDRLPSSDSSAFGFPPVHRVHVHDSTGAASNPRSGSGRTCRRPCRILAGAVLWLAAVAVSVTISCLLMRSLFPQGAEELESGSGQMSRCVLCNPGKGQVPEGGMTGIESKTTVLCCVSDEPKMQQLIIEGVRLSLQDRLKGEELYALLNNPMLPPPINKDAAHVFFRRPIRQRPTKPNAYFDQSQSDNFETLRDWSSVGESAFIRPGIELNSTRGHFRVKNAGIYVIYSRIVYEGADEDDSDVTSADETARLVFGHSVSLYQRGGGGGYRTLLEDEQATACHPRTVCYNSQIFSTLHLAKDSRIAVRATLARLVSPRAHASYFGLYKID